MKPVLSTVTLKGKKEGKRQEKNTGKLEQKGNWWAVTFGSYL